MRGLQLLALRLLLGYARRLPRFAFLVSGHARTPSSGLGAIHFLDHPLRMVSHSVLGILIHSSALGSSLRLRRRILRRVIVLRVSYAESVQKPLGLPSGLVFQTTRPGRLLGEQVLARNLVQDHFLRASAKTGELVSDLEEDHVFRLQARGPGALARQPTT